MGSLRLDAAWESIDSLGWLGHGLVLTFNSVRSMNEFWPNFATTGFVVSYVAALLSFPLLLFVALYLVWSIASVGPARKTFSSIIIIVVSVPLYPVLAALLLGLIWMVLAFVVLMGSVVGPLALFSFMWVQIHEKASDFIEKQRSESPVVEDIGFADLLFGLLLGLLCMSTFGVAACLLTLLKSPLVLLGCMLHGVLQTIPPLFKASGCWFPLWFIGWCFVFVAGIFSVVIAIPVSALVKLALGGIWPAYIATGWLRHFTGGGRRRGRNCCDALVQSIKAGYQILWASDVLTNACIVGDFGLLQQVADEFAEMAKGRRDQLSPECSRISCLPPVVIGLFTGTWEMTERAVASTLRVSLSVVRSAWVGLRNQMASVLHDAIARGIMSEEEALEVPPWLVLGLPARVLLDTVERSPPGELRLESGLCITADSALHFGRFESAVWENLQRAVSLRTQSPPTFYERDCLSGALLAGGGDESELPEGLADSVERFESLPEPRLSHLEAIRSCLVAVAVECTRQYAFRSELQKVIQEVGEDTDALEARRAAAARQGAAYRLVNGLA